MFALLVTHPQYSGATVEVVSWYMQEAENNGSTPTKTVPHPTKPGIFRVPTDEIERQALYLSKLKNVTLVMPHTVWKAYKVMLAGRRQFHERHVVDDDATEANNRHAYFIQVMINVQELLKHCIEVQIVAKAKDVTATESTIVTMGSIFANLPVQETIDDDDTISSYVPEAPVLGFGLPRFIPEDLPEESLASEWESLKAEYRPTLEHIGGLWTLTDAETSPLDPIVAGFLTETAVVLIQQKEDDVCQAREDLSVKYGRPFTHVTALDKYINPGFHNFLAISDLEHLRNRGDHRDIWPTPIRRLSKRHVTNASEELEQQDELLLRLMMDHKLEIVSMHHAFNVKLFTDTCLGSTSSISRRVQQREAPRGLPR